MKLTKVDAAQVHHTLQVDYDHVPKAYLFRPPTGIDYTLTVDTDFLSANGQYCFTCITVATEC